MLGVLNKRVSHYPRAANQTHQEIVSFLSKAWSLWSQQKVAFVCIDVLVFVDSMQDVSGKSSHVVRLVGVVVFYDL